MPNALTALIEKSPIGQYWQMIKIGAAIALVVFVGWKIYNWGYDNCEAKHNVEKIKELEDMRLKVEKSQKDYKELQDKFASVDTEGQKQLKEKQDEIDRLRTRVGNGSTGLRVPVVCKAQPAVPGGEGTPASPGVDTPTTGELAESARQDYFALRQGIVDQYVQLTACQGLLIKEREPASK